MTDEEKFNALLPILLSAKKDGKLYEPYQSMTDEEVITFLRKRANLPQNDPPKMEG